MRTAKDKPLSPGEALERFIMDDQIRCNDDVARSLDLVDEHKAAAKWVADHYRIEPREDEADYMPGIPSAERVLTSTPKTEPPRPLLLVQRMTQNRITGKRELIGSNKLFSESRRAIVKHWEENPPERPFNLRYLHDLFYAVWELSDLKQFHDTTTARKARQEKEAREREAIRQKLLSFIS